MGIIVFILIAGAWAVFLLPSFLDHRRENPRAATRAFHRSKQKLGNVTATRVDSPAYVRHHAEARRQRIFVGLLVTAVATLAVAVVRSSVIWLWITIAVDLGVGVYVALLLASRRTGSVRRASVVPMPAQPVPTAPTTAADLEVEAAPPTVRVIAG